MATDAVVVCRFCGREVTIQLGPFDAVFFQLVQHYNECSPPSVAPVVSTADVMREADSVASELTSGRNE